MENSPDPLYQQALEAEAFGHLPFSGFAHYGDAIRNRRISPPPGRYTAILIEQMGREWITERYGLPLPYYGA